MCLQGRGLGGSQGLTLRISLEPKPESMRVSRSMSRMAQATSRCRLGPGSPVHSTWRCPRRGRGGGGRSLAKPPPQAPPGSAPCPAHLPPTSPPAHQSICLSCSPQPSWRTSHSRRTSGKGNSLLNQMSSHRKQKQREPESWESGAGDSGGRGNALYQPQSHSNSQGTRRSDWTLRSHAGGKNPRQSRKWMESSWGWRVGLGRRWGELLQSAGTLPILPSRLQM